MWSILIFGIIRIINYVNCINIYGKYQINVPVEWKNMTRSQYHQWYSSEWDQCFLNDTITDKRRSCKRPNPIVGLYCGLGMGFCAMPIQTREYFFKYMMGFDNPIDTPLRRTIQSLLSRNQSIIFVGDSLMLQTFEAFLCQLHKENITLHESSLDAKCHWIIRAQFASDSASLMIHFLRIGKLETISTCPKNRIKSANGTGTWPYAQHVLLELANLGNVLVVGNIGIWYNDDRSYRKDIQQFLKFLNDLNQLKFRNDIFFLESFPSHWNSPSGYYPQKNTPQSFPSEPFVLNGQCCFPITNSSLNLNWRNTILSEVILGGEYSLSIIPTYEILFHHEHMHKCDINIPTEKWDCTHYCFYPTMLQYLWTVFDVVTRTECHGHQCNLLNPFNGSS